jgi:hypothetical protein
LIVKAFIKDLRTGPRSADVAGLDIEILPPARDRTGFHVR